MKKIMKKNQLIVTTLAIMIAVAGYLTFSKDIKEAENTSGENVVAENSDDINSEEIWDESDITVQKEDESSDVDSVPGEAVLTQSSAIIVSAKNEKAQTRAQNEAMLQEIIDNENVAEEEKQAAVSKMVEIASNSELETATESLLQAKGFTNVMVSITENSVDIVVEAEELDEVQLAQIADIVIRKTGVSNDNIVITPVSDSGSE